LNGGIPAPFDGRQWIGLEPSTALCRRPPTRDRPIARRCAHLPCVLSPGPGIRTVGRRGIGRLARMEQTLRTTVVRTRTPRETASCAPVPSRTDRWSVGNPAMNATRSSLARTAGAITTVDRRAARAYDSSYPVTAHAPRGRASLLRSSASTWTRATDAAACEPRLPAVLDGHSTQAQGRPRRCESPIRSAPAAPRSRSRSASDPRSRPADRVPLIGLRVAAHSSRSTCERVSAGDHDARTSVSAWCRWTRHRARDASRPSLTARMRVTGGCSKPSTVLRHGGRPHRPPPWCPFDVPGQRFVSRRRVSRCRGC